MSEFTINQFYIQLNTILNIIILILIFISLILIIYIIYSCLRSKNYPNKEDNLLNDILYAIYGQKTVDKNQIEQTLNRLYSEKQFYQKLYITFFNYSFIIVNIFLAIFTTIYKGSPLLKDYFFSLALIASVVLYFIYVYMDNIAVQIANQSIAIKYLEDKICMNIQSFSFNGYYKSINILAERFILQYIVIIFAGAWIIVGTIISADENAICGNLILSIIALFMFPFLLLISKYAKNNKKSMIEERINNNK